MIKEIVSENFEISDIQLKDNITGLYFSNVFKSDSITLCVSMSLIRMRINHKVRKCS